MFRPMLKIPSRSFGFKFGRLNRSGVFRFSSTLADLKIDLTAPNGREFTLNTGLFINNEFVQSSTGDRFPSIDPT